MVIDMLGKDYVEVSGKQVTKTGESLSGVKKPPQENAWETRTEPFSPAVLFGAIRHSRTVRALRGSPTLQDGGGGCLRAPPPAVSGPFSDAATWLSRSPPTGCPVHSTLSGDAGESGAQNSRG